jgi:hypothetical protein
MDIGGGGGDGGCDPRPGLGWFGSDNSVPCRAVFSLS